MATTEKLPHLIVEPTKHKRIKRLHVLAGEKFGPRMHHVTDRALEIGLAKMEKQAGLN